MKNLSVEGTVYWLVATAIIELGGVVASHEHVLEGFFVTVLDFVLAYLCWNERKIAFLSTVILGLVVSIVAFPFLFGGEQTPFGGLMDALVILASLQSVFFAYKAFREMRASITRSEVPQSKK